MVSYFETKTTRHILIICLLNGYMNHEHFIYINYIKNISSFKRPIYELILFF